MRVIPISTGELADFLGCHLEGRGDLVINGVDTIDEAGPDHLTFLANLRYRKKLLDCKAGAIIISEDEQSPAQMVRLVSNNPYRDFRKTIEKLYPIIDPEVVSGVHPNAVVDATAALGENIKTAPFVHIAEGARIGNRCIIHTGAFIGKNAAIGDDCVIGVNASIRHEVELRDRVRIGDGSVIGYDGFGYVLEQTGYTRIPPVGTVIIEDDVDIGANCCIDRATIGVTRIGRGTKLDNLIQIAHGVQVGENTAMAAQVGISGSTRIGSRVLMGGQAGLVGHIDIGNDMIIGAQAGITKSFDIKGMISGYPARPQSEAKRIEASMSRLPELLKRIRELEDKLREIDKKL